MSHMQNFDYYFKLQSERISGEFLLVVKSFDVRSKLNQHDAINKIHSFKSGIGSDKQESKTENISYSSAIQVLE